MPLLKKKRSDASDASSKLSLGGLFGGGSRKRMNQNDNINNKAVKQKTSKKKMSSSNLTATVVCPDSPGRAISSSDNTKKAGRRIKSSAPALSSVKSHDDKVLPLSTRLDSTTRIRSFGTSEYDLNSIPAAAEEEARDALPTPDSPSTPMRAGTSVHDHIYNLSVITDDILTSATDTVFDSFLCCASPVEACFEMPDVPSRVLEI